MKSRCNTEEELVVGNNRFAYSIFNDLKQNLNLIAGLLETTVENLVVLNIVDCRHMFDTETRDTPLRSQPLSGIPIISDTGIHAADHLFPHNAGLVLYRARNNNFNYVVFMTLAPQGHQVKYTICRKGEVFKLKRHFARQKCSLNKEEAPILETGLIDDIVQNSVGFLLRKKEIQRYKVKIRRGILLSGEPGNGKTMACRWIQKICDDNNISWGTITASEIERTFADGDSLDSLFNSYEVTFFDDIDISYLNRKAGNGAIACAILTAMDGLNQHSHLIRIFTTNESVTDLDEAFVRPGRIDMCFNIRKPDREMRRQLILRWHEEIVGYLKDSEQFERLLDIAEKFDFSFAELDSVKTIMVSNKLMKSGVWDLEKAMADYHRSHNWEGAVTKKKTGFGR